jgi:hypothetical protein
MVGVGDAEEGEAGAEAALLGALPTRWETASDYRGPKEVVVPLTSESRTGTLRAQQAS